MKDRYGRNQFPDDIWTFDNPGKNSRPNLYLNELYGLGIGSDWTIKDEAIPGETERQLDLMYNGQQKAVLRLGPDHDGTLVPLESTFTQYLSRAGYYDMYVDATLNRLADVDVPVFGFMMVATDGQPKPKFFLHSSTNYGSTFTKHVEMNPADNIWWFNDKIGFTPEGGLAVKYKYNITTPLKGHVVRVSTSADDTVALSAPDSVDPIGVLYSGTPDSDGYLPVVVSGRAKVLFVNSGGVTRRQFARVTVSADTGAVAGYAIGEAAPTPPLATDKHFQELGHVLETTGAAGLATVNLHQN